MKHSVTLMLVLVLTLTVFAGDLVLTPVDNGDGTLSIQYSYSGDPPVAVALVVDTSAGNGLIYGATGGGFFEVFIDCYNSNPGVLNNNDITDDGCGPIANPNGPGEIALPASVVVLSMAELDDQNDAPVSGTLATIDFGGCADGIITGESLRGCVVDVLGNEMTINGVKCGSASVPSISTGCGEPCICRGDVASSFGLPPGDGNRIDFGDLNYLIRQIAPTFNKTVADDPTIWCADTTNSLGLPLYSGDGIIDFGDLNYMISQIAPTFNGACLP